MKLKSILYLSILFVLLVNACSAPIARGRVVYGPNGAIRSGSGNSYCTEPSKRYTKSTRAVLDAEIDSLNSMPVSSLEVAVERGVTRLSDYSSSGLDLDLVLYRICEMSINRGLSNESTERLITRAIDSWAPNDRSDANGIQSKLSEGRPRLAMFANQIHTERYSAIDTVHDIKLSLYLYNVGDRVSDSVYYDGIVVFSNNEYLNFETLRNFSLGKDLKPNGLSRTSRLKIMSEGISMPQWDKIKRAYIVLNTRYKDSALDTLYNQQFTFRYSSTLSEDIGKYKDKVSPEVINLLNTYFDLHSLDRYTIK